MEVLRWMNPPWRMSVGPGPSLKIVVAQSRRCKIRDPECEDYVGDSLSLTFEALQNTGGTRAGPAQRIAVCHSADVVPGRPHDCSRNRTLPSGTNSIVGGLPFGQFKVRWRRSHSRIAGVPPSRNSGQR